jgi:DNA polymerase-1
MPQHVADTMVMAHLLGYETLALKPLVRKLLGLNVVEHAEQPVGEEFQAYAAQDARITLMLFNRLYPEIKQAGLTKLYEIEMALQPILAKASLEGFAIDRERLAAYEATTRRALDAYTDAWFSLMGQVNPLSPAQVLRAFRAQGLNIASTNEQALASYAEGGLAEAILLLGIRGYRKALGYIKQMQEAGDRITCLWQTTYVETGRLSARSPNLMNFPPMARACLRADPGRVLIAPDYSSQELRIAACLSEDPVMLELLRTGTDLHVYTAERAYDLTPDLERNWKEEPWAGMRARAKTRNFESLYGGGEEKAAYVLGVPLAKAHELAESWPGWYSFVQSMARLIETDPDPVVHTYWGRPRHVSNVRQAVNTPIQGTAGEITKLAMVLLDRMLGDEGGYQLAGRVVHQVHDSVILEVVEDRVEELKERALECMLAAVPEEWQKLCPWPSDVYTGTHWY